MKPAWKFGPDAPLDAATVSGGIIRVAYPYNTITLPLRPGDRTRTCAG